MTEQTAFPLETSVPLAHAWVSWLAEEHGIRVLFIKGPSLAHHGLRPERVSSDVDVLVAPADLDALVDLLRRNGWGERAERLERAVYVAHSITLVHAKWPCDLDIHRSFPGFLAAPQDTFDALWNRRITLAVAGQPIATTDRLGSILVAGLHALRSRSDDTRHARELRYLLDHAHLDDAERAELAALASDTGSDRSLRTVLATLGVPAPSDPSRSRGDDAALREWNLRVAAGASTGYMWWTMLRRQRGTAALKTARSALWPARDDLLRMRPETVDTPLGRLGSRAARAWSGAPGAISAARLWWTMRRARDDD